MALFSYDINEDGVKELIVGWANGRVGGWVGALLWHHSPGLSSSVLYHYLCWGEAAYVHTHAELITGNLTQTRLLH